MAEFPVAFLPHELDFKQAVVERSTLDLDVVFEIELALEGSRRDALIQERMIGAALGLPIGLAAGDRQLVLLSSDCDLLRREAGDRQRNPIAILTGTDDVVGGIVVLAVQPLGVVDEIEQAIEADAGPP